MAVDQKAYRRYHATIERALTLFDVNSDWADYIAFLTRLLKSLETGKPEGLIDVPCRARIALCLARCLQPHLPSGVHQKALDVYSEVFSIIGLQGLARDLSLYLPGLSHTLAFANLATRPLVLDLFEEYILKLKPTSLRPALKALILSLLPVIEEESSEDFERCLGTFDALRSSLAAEKQEAFFWQTLFIASVSNPLRRPGVLVYLNYHLPKLESIVHENGDSLTKTTSPDSLGADVIIKPEPGLLVRCFATGLRDEQPLVQRGFLDLLVTHLPLNATVLQNNAYSKDLDVLVTAAVMIVLRRDMGLNRRLWAWYTGSDGKADVQVTSPMEDSHKRVETGNDYFSRFGLSSTIRSIQALLDNTTSSPGPRTIPFRVALSLMDRWEIGGQVMKTSFAPMMRSFMIYQSSAPTQAAFDEVYRSASALFDGMESATLSDCLSSLVTAEEIDLIIFIVANFNLEQIDMAQTYMYRLSGVIATKILDDNIDRSSWLALLNSLVTTIPPPNGLSTSSETHVADELLRNVAEITSNMIIVPEDGLLLPAICACLEQVIVLRDSLDPLLESSLLKTLQTKIFEEKSEISSSFPFLDACARILVTLLQRRSDVGQAAEQACLDCLSTLLRKLWIFLGTSTPQYHVVIVEHFWRLHDVTSEYEIVESTILHQLDHTLNLSEQPTSEQIERFGVLFHHTKTIKRSAEDSVPQMLQRASLRILDSTSGQERNEPGVQWLLSLQNISPIVALVLVTQFGHAQAVALTLYRTQKLMRIVYLSEDHWRTFSSSPELPIVRSFCLSLVQRKNTELSRLSHDAFRLLRMLYDNRSGNVPPEELVLLLVGMLGDADSKTLDQEEVLDTLLAILNDKSILPSSLVSVLLQGVATVPIDERLDKWITLLCNFLPNHAALLPSLLKTTSNFCKRIEQAFEDLQMVFGNGKQATSSKSPERSIINLLSGLEYVLARAHQLIAQSTTTNGVASEPVSNRSRANDRLTVILCMQDAVRICTKLWCWKSMPRSEGSDNSKAITGDVKSFQYSATKLRSRSRKILENLIEAESQECLETLIGMWTTGEKGQILDLLQTLNGARPRSMLPALFNAIYSRTNLATLNSSQKSSLSIQTNATELTMFLNEYTSALEDDMLEEIWTDCATFLRGVLANPMPHRQILIKLLRFCSLLSQKMENTSFGEESRMYRELADICTRLFTAIFTIKPSGFDGSGPVTEPKLQASHPKASKPEDDNMLTLLVDILPVLNPLMGQSDRLNTVYTGIATNIITPSVHARLFPSNMTVEHLEVLRLMSTSLGASKTWRKDLVDSFYNPRFFQSSLELVKRGWLPLVRQLQISEKMIVAESLARIAPPAAAGIMFGVGATAARNEADKRTQLDLRRITTLILASDTDSSLSQLPQLLQKIEELFGATLESSPSLAIRGDVYVLIRALLLKTTHSNLYPLWPILDRELQDFCKDILAGSESKYTSTAKLQGIKLLDLLLLLRPDEFQLHEWLFVTDTMDAVYPSVITQPTSFADEIAPMLNAGGTHFEPPTHTTTTLRRPWLYGSDLTKTEDMDSLLAGFFGQLSIRAFEDLYSLLPLDEEACKEDLLADVFSEVMS